MGWSQAGEEVEKGSESPGLLRVPISCGCLGGFLRCCPACSLSPGSTSGFEVFRG